MSDKRPLKDRILDLRRAEQQAKEVLAQERAIKPVLVFDGEERLEPIEWLIEDVIPAEGAGELFGEKNEGKTFVSVGWAVHVAANLPWMKKAVKGGTVLFVESEGGRSFAVRKHAAKGAAGLGDSYAQGTLDAKPLPFVTVYQPLGFGHDTDTVVATNYALSIRASVEARKLPPIRFVVTDTLSQNMVGDANDNSEMQAFLRVFRAFLKALSDEPVFGLLIRF